VRHPRPPIEGHPVDEADSVRPGQIEPSNRPRSIRVLLHGDRSSHFDKDQRRQEEHDRSDQSRNTCREGGAALEGLDRGRVGDLCTDRAEVIALGDGLDCPR
jgi:hypothetical protein